MAHAKHQPHANGQQPDAKPATSAAKHASAPLTSALRALTLTRDEQPITLLLVDDDPDCRMLIRDAVAECNVSNRIYEVANGRDALKFLNREAPYTDAPRPGLIFMDIEMPVMDGMETLRRIREDKKLTEIPVVMMTGVSDETQMQRAAALGANSYTIKPANAEQFLRTVLASTNYWLTIHQYPHHHLPAEKCKR